MFFLDNFDVIFAHLLNVHPSKIESIRSCKKDDDTRIFITLKKADLPCTYCENHHVISNGFFNKSMKVPNLPFENCLVVHRVRRYYCSRCSHTFSDLNHMTPSGHSVSYATILQLMQLLQNPKITFKYAAAILSLSESTVMRLFDKHCHVSRIPFPEVICIDEVYTKNSDFDAKYSCVFYDFYNSKILDVHPSRKKRHLHQYFQSIPKKELDNVRFVCIDMYLPYKQISRCYFKKAIICVDSFHVVKHINDDLSKLRIRLMKRYPTDSIEYYLLKHWKNLLFDRTLDLDNEGKYNKRLGYHVNFHQLLDLMLSIDPQLKKAYELKEAYIMFNSSATLEDAPERLDKIIQELTLANIDELQEFTGLLIHWRQEIINSFTYYKGKRINSSVAESMNATIKDLLFNTKGIRNNERRKKRIMYAINKTEFTLK